MSANHYSKNGNRKNRSLIPYEEVVARYLAGATPTEISKIAHISSQAITGILKRRGIKKRSAAESCRKRRKFNYEEIIADYESGLTLKQVAKKHNSNDPSGIRKIILRGGGKTRTPKETVLRGEKHPQWKGGKTHDKDGYVIVNNKKHHRVIAEQLMGRSLQFWEVVHHIDGVKNNNSPNNLVIMPIREHTRFEGFLIHRGLPHTRELLTKYARPESERYYRFTTDDFAKASELYPLPKGHSAILKQRAPKVCCIKGCGRKRVGRGLCNMHWQRKRAEERGGWIAGGGRKAKLRRSWLKNRP